MYSVRWAVLELVCLIQEGRFGTVNDIVLYDIYNYPSLVRRN